MAKLSASIRLLFPATVIFLVIPQIASAQPPQGGAAAVRTAEQQYKNIKVLQGTPADQLVESMHVMSGALGVECEYCHDETDRAKDDKKPKVVARKMLTMMMDINKNSFDGMQTVTCFTCHQGHPEPMRTQPLPVSLAVLEEDEKPGPALPSADQILAKYVQALGGADALKKITSEAITATQDLPTGAGGVTPVPAKLEEYRKAPNLTMDVAMSDKITVADGFDGSNAWAQNAAGQVANAANPDQMRIRRAADLYEPVTLKDEYEQMRVARIVKINGHDTYLVVATPKGDAPERLYFDTQTGLLLRKATVIPTGAGNAPFEVDYDDYRSAGHDVKVPYVISMFPATPHSHLQTHTTIRVQKVQQNVAIDDAKFVKPASKPIAAPAPAPAR